MLNLNGTYTVLPHSKYTIPFAKCPISAGYPAETTDDYELLDLNEIFTGGREGFAAYTVNGDSMVDAIKPGYIVIVDTFAAPAHGDIVASFVCGRLSIKILEKKDTGLYLVAVNKNYAPRRIVESDNLHIIGVVKGHVALY